MRSHRIKPNSFEKFNGAQKISMLFRLARQFSFEIVRARGLTTVPPLSTAPIIADNEFIHPETYRAHRNAPRGDAHRQFFGWRAGLDRTARFYSSGFSTRWTPSRCSGAPPTRC
jgi:hypothetical protein